MRKVSELQYLAGDLVDFLKLSTFINASLPLPYIFFDEVDRGLGRVSRMKITKTSNL